MKNILYYVHDPMCSWCWGFSKTYSELLKKLPSDIEVQRLLGGLAHDSDVPMYKLTQEQIKSNWTRIEDTISGVKFNFEFWEKCIPRRSTYPACRAVIAAREQGEQYDVLMTKEIQNAYYHDALNPSDDSILIKLVEKLNLDIEKFETDFLSNETQTIFSNEMRQARELYVESYPNLVLQIKSGETFTISLDYNNSEVMFNEIKQKLI